MTQPCDSRHSPLHRRPLPADLRRPIEEPRPVFADFGLAADGEGAGVAQRPATEDADPLPIALAAAAHDDESGMGPTRFRGKRMVGD